MSYPHGNVVAKEPQIMHGESMTDDEYENREWKRRDFRNANGRYGDIEQRQIREEGRTREQVLALARSRITIRTHRVRTAACTARAPRSRVARRAAARRATAPPGGDGSDGSDPPAPPNPPDPIPIIDTDVANALAATREHFYVVATGEDGTMKIYLATRRQVAS